MAGFQNKRAAQGVKDDLMAVTAVIDDGQTRIGIISADTIGLMRKFVLSVREDVPAEWYLITSWCMPLTIMRVQIPKVFGSKFFKKRRR